MKRRKSYPIIDGHKQCLDCNQVKPASDYRKSIKSSGGITPSCRACLSEKMRNTRRANGMPPNTWKAYPVINGVKKCYKCLNDYPIDQYNFKSGYMRHMCRECDIGTFEERVAKSRARYAREKERRSIRVAERRRDPQHRQKFLDWANKFNKKNHESGKWAEWYREQSRLLTDTYLSSVINQRSSKKGNIYIPKEDIPQEVFELLRTKIKLQRELRQLNSLNQ
jgi:hypothetical protein